MEQFVNEELKIIAEELSKKDFLVFAGAGVPKSAGVPNWETLLIELAKNINFDCSTKIDSANPNEYPKLAQEIFDEFKRQNKENIYYDTIKNVIKPTNAPYSVEQLEIIKTTNWVITTNFDSTFETAFKTKFQLQNINKKLKIESLPTFTFENHFKEETLVYLHGNVDEKYIVLKEDDYNKYYPSVIGEKGSIFIEQYLRYIFKEFTIVFIGFSFNDYYLREIFKIIFNELKISDEIASEKPNYLPRIQKIKHYCFLKKPNSKNEKELSYFDVLIKQLEEINIKVIIYDEHIDWINCFEIIRELKETSKSVLEVK